MNNKYWHFFLNGHTLFNRTTFSVKQQISQVKDVWLLSLKKVTTGNVEFLSRSGRTFGGREISEEEDAVDTTKQDPRIVERIEVESAQIFRKRFLPDLKKRTTFIFQTHFYHILRRRSSIASFFSVAPSINHTFMTIWKHFMQ